ncbi:MAG: HAMP domain-containing protein, partial [Nitrospirae bacterium]|nr:HAMP domain-containing protein [Nitrospirota bacterium]
MKPADTDDGNGGGPHSKIDERLSLLLDALLAMKAGDFSVRMPDARNGIIGKIAEAFNDVVSINQKMSTEIVRVSKIIVEEGRMTERMAVASASGSWANTSDAINVLINSMAQPTVEVARVITSVANGDLSNKMALEVEGKPIKGEFLRIGTTVNNMVDQLNAFASEVIRVSKEVGAEGKLGGQAEVKGVAGTWKELTDNVNMLAGNLTGQVRNIALVTTAVANGDLSRKITVEAKGEILEL